MALTKNDLTEVRTIVVDSINGAFEQLFIPRFDELDTRLTFIESAVSKNTSQLARVSSETNRNTVELAKVNTELQRQTGKITALSNDIKELYSLTS